jgi:hypothetical protein
VYVRIIPLNVVVFQQHFEILHSAVHYVIKCTGTAERFRSSSISLNEERSDKISVYNTVSSYSVDIQEVYNTGKCVSLFCDTLYSFLDKKGNF